MHISGDNIWACGARLLGMHNRGIIHNCILYFDHSSFATASVVICAPATTTFTLCCMGTTFGFFFNICKARCQQKIKTGTRFILRSNKAQRAAALPAQRTFFHTSATVLQAIAMPPAIAMIDVTISCACDKGFVVLFLMLV
jgi:hypothetical protein